MPATESAPTPPPASRGPTPVTWALVAANVLALALVEAAGSATDLDDLVRAGAMERGRLWAGQWWRFVTATFLHVGWPHLAMNVAAAVLLARPVERALGSVRFASVWLAGGIAGSALSALGRDVVSAGASGSLHAVLGAALVLHGLALGSLRAFLRNRAVWVVAISLAAWACAALVLSIPLDHLAHAGGLLAGAAVALAFEIRPSRRPGAIGAVAAGIVLLAAAAAWPRGEPTRYEAASRGARIHAALRRLDRAEARRLLAEADAAGQPGPELDYYRGLLRLQEGDLAGALAILRPLAEGPPGTVRDEARARAASAARVLGLRHAAGRGVPPNPLLGLAYLDEACALGDEGSCRRAEGLRREIAR